LPGAARARATARRNEGDVIDARQVLFRGWDRWHAEHIGRIRGTAWKIIAQSISRRRYQTTVRASFRRRR